MHSQGNVHQLKSQEAREDTQHSIEMATICGIVQSFTVGEDGGSDMQGEGGGAAEVEPCHGCVEGSRSHAKGLDPTASRQTHTNTPV